MICVCLCCLRDVPALGLFLGDGSSRYPCRQQSTSVESAELACGSGQASLSRKSCPVVSHVLRHFRGLGPRDAHSASDWVEPPRASAGSRGRTASGAAAAGWLR